LSAGTFTSPEGETFTTIDAAYVRTGAAAGYTHREDVPLGNRARAPLRVRVDAGLAAEVVRAPRVLFNFAASGSASEEQSSYALTSDVYVPDTQHTMIGPRLAVGLVELGPFQLNASLWGGVSWFAPDVPEHGGTTLMTVVPRLNLGAADTLVQWNRPGSEPVCLVWTVSAAVETVFHARLPIPLWAAALADPLAIHSHREAIMTAHAGLSVEF
jgi:hypothetical protein